MSASTPPAPLRICTWALLALVGIITLVPAYWLLVSSFKPVSAIVTEPVPIPSRLTLENYVYAFQETLIGRWLLNTAWVGIATTALGLLVTSLAAFALAKHRFRGRDAIFLVLLASLAIPDYVTLIPSFVIIQSLGLLNTFWSVILPLSAHVLTLFLLRQYIRQVPDEILDAARIDGCSEFRIYWNVVMPLIKPGLGAGALLLFLHSWNAYLFPLVMLRGQDMYTMPLGLAFLHSQLDIQVMGASPWAGITAGAVMSVVPAVLCLVLMQRQFIAGLTSGAVKE
jgi:ABC-type glycerol-3-phosphate transport system permease component